MKFWNKKQSFNFHENIVENFHGTAVLVLGIKAQVNSNENEDPTKIIQLISVAQNRRKWIPVNIVKGEGFGEEDEGENNTDSFAESGDGHSEEGSKLSDQTQDNLKVGSYLEYCLFETYLDTEVASERKYKGITVGVFGVVWAVVDGGGNICEDCHQEK